MCNPPYSFLDMGDMVRPRALGRLQPRRAGARPLAGLAPSVMQLLARGAEADAWLAAGPKSRKCDRGRIFELPEGGVGILSVGRVKY